ncbi:MAG: extensin family protein [Alphaproteobacteria bacterium]
MIDRQALFPARFARLGVLLVAAAAILAGCAGRGEVRENRTGLQSLNAGYPRSAGALRPSLSDEQRLARLRAAGVVFRKVADQTGRRGCRIRNSIEITEVAGVALSKPSIVTLALAERFEVWVRQTLVPAAREELDSKVAKLWVFGTYSCRFARGRKWGGVRRRLSQHAYANAIDIGGMWLANGDLINIRKDWRRRGRRVFLRRIALKGCDVFSVALTPDYDWVHRNHFHFDAAAHKLCGYRGKFKRRYAKRRKRRTKRRR